MRRKISSLTFCVLALAAGCGGSGTTKTDMANTNSDMASAVVDLAVPPSDMTTYIPIPNGCNTTQTVTGTVAYTTLSANMRCMGPTCHNKTQAPNFSTQATFMNVMINQPSSSNFDYVVPNMPQKSYLLYKLRGLQQNVPNGSGSQMPNGGTPLNDTDFCTIYNWVMHGAPTT